MKNIKGKIFTIVATAVMLIGAGTSAGSGVLPYPDTTAIPGIGNRIVLPENHDKGNTPEAGINPNCDLNDDFEFDE